MPDPASKRRWKAENTKNLVITINKNTDKEIFEWLSDLNEPYGKLIKGMIKEHIKQSSAQPAGEK